jgi:LysR family hydrogen peroxide-inducible transcriptional activator
MSIRNLGFRDLRYIVAIADLGTFGRAAEACHISQPALSERIKRIEESLDILLFERSKSKTLITSQGRILADHARSLLAQVDLIDDELRQQRPPLQTTLKLGIIATLGPYLMPLLLPTLRARFHELELIINEGLTEPLLDKLIEGDLDLLIAAAPLVRNGLRVDSLFNEPFLLALPQEHPLNRRKNIYAKDLNGKDMVLLEDGHCLSGQALSVCGARQRKNPNRLHAMTLETLKHMVATGAGYTLLPELAVPRVDPLGNLVTYKRLADKESPGRHIVMATRANDKRRADFESLGRVLKEVVPASYVGP